MKKVRVLHVSTAHQPQDPRIVFKQCPTLADAYKVFCALPHADPTLAPNVHFIRLPYFRRVIWRTFITCPFILLRCLGLRPKIVHVYVPEFLPFAWIFWLFGAKVIYEVQENLHKKWHLKAFNRGYLLEKAFRWFDRFARKHYYLIFTDHGYLDTYMPLGKPHEVIYNYPSLSFLEPFRQPYRPDPTVPVFFYIGWLSFERAFDTIVESFVRLKAVYPDFIVHLFGRHSFTDTDLIKLPDFAYVRPNLRFYGYTNQREAFSRITHVTAGLALLKPVGDYPDSYTTKLFEYMALGLPVVISDFPLYKDIVEGHNCGICVSPYNSIQVADALVYLVENQAEAQEMGERGRKAVELYYNWTTEAQKLIEFYQLVLSRQ